MTIERNANLGVFSQERIDRIARETQRRTRARHDYVATREKLGVTVIEATVTEDATRHPGPETLGLTLQNGKESVYPLKRSALLQIAGSVRIPATFVDRLTDAGHHDLAAATISELLTREPETDSGRARKHLVRELDGSVDAFLSDSFLAVPHDTVLALALQEFEEAGAQVWDLRLSDTEFRVLAAAPHISGQITKDRNFSGMSRWVGAEGDTLNAGLEITNSETGHARFRLRSSIFRRICCNFNIWADVISKVHLGAKLEEGEQHFVSEKTRQLENQALASKLRDAVASTFDPKEFRRILDAINVTTTRELGDQPIKVVNAAVVLYELDEARRDSIIERLLVSGDKSQFGLSNAISAEANPEHAKDLSDERKSSFEEGAGKLLRLSTAEWTSFLAAAYRPVKETEAKEAEQATQTVARVR